MKYIINSGGLGNQMFRYAFYKSLIERGYKVSFLRNRLKYLFQKDEIEHVFEGIKLINGAKDYFFSIFYSLISILPKNIKDFFLKLVSFYEVKENSWFIFNQNAVRFKNINEIFIGTWQSELYFDNVKDKITSYFKFNSDLLTSKTLSILKEIDKTQSVAVHIRRGDYLSKPYIDEFSNICTLSYYKNAINYLEDKVSDAKFFLFTDDLQWAKINLNERNVVFVDINNERKNSWQDMYLMSRCKHQIIANSTFSWWAAYLNINKSKIVIAPSKWINTLPKDDIVPQSWIRL